MATHNIQPKRPNSVKINPLLVSPTPLLLPTPRPHLPPLRHDPLLEMRRATLDDKMHVNIRKMQHCQSAPELGLLKKDYMQRPILLLIRMKPLVKGLLPVQGQLGQNVPVQRPHALGHEPGHSANILELAQGLEAQAEMGVASVAC